MCCLTTRYLEHINKNNKNHKLIDWVNNFGFYRIRYESVTVSIGLINLHYFPLQDLAKYRLSTHHTWLLSFIIQPFSLLIIKLNSRDIQIIRKGILFKKKYVFSYFLNISRIQFDNE